MLTINAKIIIGIVWLWIFFDELTQRLPPDPLKEWVKGFLVGATGVYMLMHMPP